jgi:hypothetical protein
MNLCSFGSIRLLVLYNMEKEVNYVKIFKEKVKQNSLIILLKMLKIVKYMNMGHIILKIKHLHYK